MAGTSQTREEREAGHVDSDAEEAPRVWVGLQIVGAQLGRRRRDDEGLQVFAGESDTRGMWSGHGYPVD